MKIKTFLGVLLGLTTTVVVAQKPEVIPGSTFSGTLVVEASHPETTMQNKPMYVVVDDHQHQALPERHARKAEQALRKIQKKKS
jgi:hypothetical protein